MGRQVPAWRPRPAGRCDQVRRLRLPSGEAVALGEITSALFLAIPYCLRRPPAHFPRGRAFACLLVPGQAGGATVDAAGGATVDVRIAGGATVAAGGATVDAAGAPPWT